MVLILDKNIVIERKVHQSKIFEINFEYLNEKQNKVNTMAAVVDILLYSIWKKIYEY